jgi:hypothetical protein
MLNRILNRRTGFRPLALTATLLVVPAMSPAQPAPAAPSAAATPADLEPAALDALDKMGAYLRTLASFEVHSQATLEDVLDSGQKLQFDNAVQLRARRPDRLWAEVASDRKTRQFFYDGKTFTIYGPRNKLYASVPAPATLRELVAAIETRYGILLPLADLFRWGTDPTRREDFTAASYIGPATIHDTPCDHLAFREKGFDWQVWIQKGDSPLPRKLVITTTDDPALPQYAAVLDWNLAPALNDKMFTFEPPPDAHRIAIRELTAEPAPEN